MSRPPAPPPGAGHAQAALRAVSLVQQLTVEALQARGLEELAFRVVNRTHALTPYDRAVCFSFAGSRPRVLAVSGLASVDADSRAVRLLAALAAGLPEAAGARPLPPELLEADPHWAQYAALTGPCAVAWCPLFAGETLAGGLWLERRGAPWGAGELRLLDQLAVPYGELLARHARPGPLGRLRGLGKRRLLLLALVVLAVLLAVRVPLRVVAPCELAPEDPFPVTAPLAGVIAEALVEPGQAVAEGQALFVYDKRVVLEELNLARQQVRLLESSLARSRMQAFGDAKAKGEIALLEIRLEQERIRQSLSEFNAERLEVTAGRSGVVSMDDPDQWRGKPVAVGERLLTLVEPGRVKLRIWLPMDDNVPFEPGGPVTAYLASLPDTAVQGRLRMVAKNVASNASGVLGVAAEATVEAPPAGALIGVQGTAVLHGPRVSLAYWLLRRPLAWLRGATGF